MATLPSYAELSGVFDEYKIAAVKVTYRPAFDSVINGGSGGPQCYAHICVDPASTLNPAGTYTSSNLNTFMENAGVKTYTCNKPFSVYLKPKVSEAYLGGTTADEVRTAPFIKSSSTSVDHRGFHMFLQNNGFLATNAFSLDIYTTYYMTWRNPR